MLTVLVAFAFGDDDMPTTPTPTPDPDPASKLIGTWKYTGNDFDTKLAANLGERLIGEGLTASLAGLALYLPAPTHIASYDPLHGAARTIYSRIQYRTALTAAA